MPSAAGWRWRPLKRDRRYQFSRSGPSPAITLLNGPGPPKESTVGRLRFKDPSGDRAKQFVCTVPFILSDVASRI